MRHFLLCAAALGAFVLNAGPADAMNYQNITAQAAREKMLSGAPLRIVDVRTPAEFAQGHIPQAVNVPLDSIEAGKIPFIMADKTATYLIYCRSGRRSEAAASILANRGWQSVYNFGGILDWPYEIVR